MASLMSGPSAQRIEETGNAHGLIRYEEGAGNFSGISSRLMSMGGNGQVDGEGRYLMRIQSMTPTES